MHVLCFFLAGCGAPAGSGDPATIRAEAQHALRQGELDRAEDLIARGLSVAGAEAPLLRLLQAELLLMQRDVEPASAIIDEPAPADARVPALEARRRYLVGFRQMVNGEIEAATDTLGRVSEPALAAGAVDVALDADILAGQALFRLSRWDEAGVVLTRARALARSSGDLAREAGALVNLGMGQLVRDRFDAALDYFDQVLAFEGIEDDLTYAVAMSNAGLCHARLGAFGLALDLQQRAVNLYESRNVPSYLEETLGELGHTHFLQGDAEDALALLNRARAVASGAGRTERAALWTDSSATVLIELERWDDAERLNEESIALKQTSTASLAPNLINRGGIALGRGDHDRAIGAFTAALEDDEERPWVLGQAHAGLADALMRLGRTADALAQFQRALDVVEDTRLSLVRPEYRISFLARMIHFHRAYVEALMAAGEPLRALEVADASRARVLAERSGQDTTARVRASVLVARARRAAEVSVAYWLGPARSFAWVITGQDVHHVELPAAAEIDGLVANHRTFIEQSIGDPSRTAWAPGDALGAAVLAPILPFVPAGAAVTVVPDGSLHAVNFETLPVGADRRYWIEDVIVSVAPALSMVGGAPPARPTAERALLVVGDPIDETGTLPRLQYAGAEVDAVRAAFDSSTVSVVRGAEATPAAFLAGRPERYSTIHFAAHATTSALSPLDSAIELSAGPEGTFKLYVRDIAGRALGADLVTISACRSAGNRAYGGEGLVGLAWGFLRAGASRVIAGLWDVDDQSTATLMTETYRGIAAGQSPAEALRAAKLRLIAGGGNFAKPYYWAPFQVFTAA